MYEFVINLCGKTIKVFDYDGETQIGTLSNREAFSAIAGEGFVGVFFRNRSGVVTEGRLPDYYIREELGGDDEALFTPCTDYPYDTVEIDGTTYYTFKFRRKETIYTPSGATWGGVASGMRVACLTDLAGDTKPWLKAINYVERSTDKQWVKVSGTGYTHGYVNTGLATGSMPSNISMYGTWQTQNVNYSGIGCPYVLLKKQNSIFPMEAGESITINCSYNPK